MPSKSSDGNIRPPHQTAATVVDLIIVAVEIAPPSSNAVVHVTDRTVIYGNVVLA